MRILTVVRDLGPGGTQRAAQNCAIFYHRNGGQSALLATHGGGPREVPLRQEGVVLFLGGAKAVRQSGVRESAEWKPDIIHIHRSGMADPESAEMLRTLRFGSSGSRVPVVETNHFARADRSSGRELIDLHIQLSRWCMWKWKMWGRGLAPAPAGVIIPHMADDEVFRPATPHERAAVRRRLGIPDNAFVFGRVGQPKESGWSPVIFRAFADFRRQNPAVDAWLLVAGLSPSMARRHGRLPEQLRSRVVSIPFVHGDDSLREHYAAMDCFLHAKAIGESFGYVLVEAMLCETPVITLSTPLRDNSQLEVVGHGRGGLVVADRPSMVAAMKRLHEDAPLRRRLGTGGHEWARQQYAPAVVGPQLWNAMECVRHAAGDDLRSCLEQHGLQTDRKPIAIDGLMSDMIGRPHRATRLMLQVVHQPALYGAFRSIKRMLLRR